MLAQNARATPMFFFLTLIAIDCFAVAAVCLSICVCVRACVCVCVSVSVCIVAHLHVYLCAVFIFACVPNLKQETNFQCIANAAFSSLFIFVLRLAK